MKRPFRIERSALRGGLLSGLLLLGVSAPGCSDSDACKGRSETCISLTLSGADGVTQADQLEVQVLRQPKPEMPMVPLGEPRPLPFKVAVLWPDGPGTLSVRSYLQGKLNGVTAELALDLRNGAHDQRKLTLFPPLVGMPLGDLGGTPPRDMAAPPADMTAPPADMTSPPADMTSPPVDMTSPADMSAPTD
jgi:hypothetical protein